MTPQEVVEDADEERDRLLAARHRVPRGEQDAVVVASRRCKPSDLPLEVRVVLGQDSPALAGEQTEEVLVAESFEIGALVQADRVVPLVAETDRDAPAVHLVEGEPQANSSWLFLQAASARSATARSRSAIPSTSPL